MGYVLLILVLLASPAFAQVKSADGEAAEALGEQAAIKFVVTPAETVKVTVADPVGTVKEDKVVTDVSVVEQTSDQITAEIEKLDSQIAYMQGRMEYFQSEIAGWEARKAELKALQEKLDGK